MKSGAVAASILALVIIATVSFGLRSWRHQETVSAEYKPLPAFTAADKFFAQKAHDLIKTSMHLDQEAAGRSKSQSVRDFARDSAGAEALMLDRLEKTVAAISSDFIFRPPETVEPETPSSPERNFDRDYLHRIIRTQERALALIEDTSGILNSSGLLEFAPVWRAHVNGRIEAARPLLAALPETPCP